MVVVFGKNGQVAKSIRTLKSDWTFLSSSESPFTDTDIVIKHLEHLKPKWVINTAAYTQVDKAESEKELCFKINTETPAAIAKWCKKNSATLVHFSTDYVFDGSGEKPWLETDTPAPLNYYGETKLKSEQEIVGSGCEYYIFRISWVYSNDGQNFPNTMKKLFRTKEELRIVNDQWGSPTSATDVAHTVCNLVDTKKPKPKCGIYHLCFAPYTTWYKIACDLWEKEQINFPDIITKKIIPITTEEYPTPARRPKNSRLATIRQESFPLS
ncbi:MAG: dTDP-4-dehydrorhamnose reductase [Bdellovibrionaceae bacterium]|nr:dTDP-4-dehydrorhamnose reductase [Pseudobdellovibrionaceae bacterium]